METTNDNTTWFSQCKIAGGFHDNGFCLIILRDNKLAVLFIALCSECLSRVPPAFSFSFRLVAQYNRSRFLRLGPYWADLGRGPSL